MISTMRAKTTRTAAIINEKIRLDDGGNWRKKHARGAGVRRDLFDTVLSGIVLFITEEEVKS